MPTVEVRFLAAILFLGLSAVATAEPVPTFLTDRATVWVGGTAMIPFSVEAKVAHDLTLSSSVEGDGLDLIGSATVVEGYRLGFVRVRGVKPGSATLKVGGASIAVDVERHPARDRQIASPPRIVAPATGAAVWGRVAVGVELFDGPVRLGLTGREVSLRVPQGVTVERLESTTPDHGPVRLVSFVLDLSEIEPGPIEIAAQTPGANSNPVTGQTVTLNVVAAPADRLITGEAEAHRDATRPRRYGQKPPKLTEAENASGGRYVNNNGSRPQLVIPATLEKNGWYQMVLTAASDPGGGAWPTVGLRTHDPEAENENNEQYRVAGQVVSRDWQRHAIGRPLWLKAGDVVLIPQFENDFNAGRKSGDRNLRIDRYELLRLDGRPPTTVAGEVVTADLVVAFADALHGRTLAGDTRIVGVTHRREAKQSTPPRITLFVDDEAYASQTSARPVFELSRGAVKPTGSTLRLEALAEDGTVAHSPTVAVTMAALPDGSTVADRADHRFPLADPRWDASTRESLAGDKRVSGERVRHFASQGHADLTLPEELTGPFAVRIGARGDQFDGPPIAKVTLLAGDGEPIDVGEVKVNTGYYKTFDAGTIELPAGPKRLRVAFINDKYDAETKKDRNLSLQSVNLTEPGPADQTPPAARIVYPAPEAELFGVDAVVVEVADDREAAWVELLVDGQRTGIRDQIDDGLSRRLLPLPLRGFASGGHALSVRAADAAGNVTESEPVSILVASQAPAAPGPYERAVRLLDRFAFGPESRALADVLVMGESDYLRAQLDMTEVDPGVANAWRAAIARQPADNNGGQVVRRALDLALTTPNPVRARLTLFIDNHFTTWQRKARAERKAIDHATFVELGPAPFADLLHASATSPAMLYYLDQHRSYGKRLNENYAREIMELHSLGVDGGYTQRDVTELANILTGWSMVDHARLDGGGGYHQSSFRYIPGLNDPASRVVFGLRLPEVEDYTQRYDRVEMVLDMLAAHPSTARFISTKLAEHYLTVPAPPAVVDRLTEAYLESGGDLAAMMFAIAESDAMSEPAFQPRLLHPIDYALRLSRTTGDRNPGAINGFLNRSGFGLFDRDTPDGYPEEDQAYADTNAMLQRWRFARRLESRLTNQLPWTMRNPAKDADDGALAAWRQRVVDYYAICLTGRPLGESSNAAAMIALDQAELQPNDSIRMIATLIAQMPEANLH